MQRPPFVPILLLLFVGLLATACGEGDATDTTAAETEATQTAGSTDEDESTDATDDTDTDTDATDDTDTDTGDAELTGDEEQVREVFDAHFEAYSDGDAEAVCDLYTDEYQQEIVDDAAQQQIEGDSCQEVVETYTALVADIELGPEVDELEVDGDEAHVTYTTELSDGGLAMELTRVDGEWRISATE